MPKTADYTRKAIDKYREKNDFINLKFPKGTKDRLKELGISNSDLVDECINFINSIAETLQEDAEESVDYTQAHTAQISPVKKEREEIPKKPVKAKNKANKEPIDIYALQAELDARREEERRKIDEKEAEKERERQRQADELVEKIQQMRQEQTEREIEGDRDKFPKFDEEKLRAALLSDKEFREDSANPKYKDDFVKEYGKCNYAMIQRCIQEIKSEDKERIRQESMQRAKMDY